MYGVSDRYGVINGGPPRFEEVRAWSLSLARARVMRGAIQALISVAYHA